ncbi:MAG: hypothetical protein EXR58_06260 [Chloroflexi bacterium]|nr:hypothetical protein [Chloroflexota bacterium]
MIPTPGPTTIRRRLIPERFRRVWTLAEFISSHPGASRSQLARRFSISERQLQADLGIIRREIGLPLVRAHGYRLHSEGIPDQGLTLRDIHTLFQVLDRASRDPSIAQAEVVALASRLLAAFPPYLRPLAEQTLVRGRQSEGGVAPPLLDSLTEALVDQAVAKLTFATGRGPHFPIETLIRPELLIPYRTIWHLVGWSDQQKRLLMFSLEGLRTVTLEL